MRQGCIEAAAVAYMVERMRMSHAGGLTTDPPDAADHLLEFVHAVGAEMHGMCHHRDVVLAQRGGGLYRIECAVERKHADCDERTDWYGTAEEARTNWAERVDLSPPF